MSVFDSVRSLLSQYAPGAGPTPAGDVSEHFQQLSQSVDVATLVPGIAAALRSDQTPPFAQLVSQLFSSASGDQKLAMLNTLVSSASPQLREQLSALIPGLGVASSLTAAQASTVSPAAIQSVTQHVEQHDASIVEKMSAVYAAHPTLVQTLGSAAMMLAMRTIAQRHGQNA